MDILDPFSNITSLLYVTIKFAILKDYIIVSTISA